jgi:hypothetical protein
MGAALQQWDELWQAAGQVGSSVSAIPLYYALAQASRAICAIHVTEPTWDAPGHGLAIRSPTHVLGDTVIEPHVGDSNLFAAFCDAIGSPRLRSAVALSEVWAFVPNVDVVEGLGLGCLRPIRLEARGSDRPVSAFLDGDIADALSADMGEAQAQLRERLASYPQAAEGLMISQPYPAEHRPVEICWRTDDGLRIIDSVGAGWGPPNTGSYLWPSLGSMEDVPTFFAAWWMLLLAMSSLARYEPDRWMKALDRDSSPMAIPIEKAIALAHEILPWLVLYALEGQLASQQQAATEVQSQ